MSQILISISVASIFLSLLFISPAIAGETTIDPIAEKRAWISATISEHRVTGSDACLASTASAEDGGRLELYSEKSVVDGYVEPFIQVTVTAGPSFIGGEVVFDGKEKFALTADLSNASPEAAMRRFIAPLGSRGDIVRALKRRNKAVVSLKAINGEVLRLEFSLSGSSHVISQTFKHCDIRANFL